MFGMSATAYDLKFRLLDIPVRVHPSFWFVAALLGWNDDNLGLVALWIVCMLVSIVVHEYGHGLTTKYFRGTPSILLYAMGGLCQSEGQRTKAQRLAVVLAGPAAGLLLLIVCLLTATLILGITPVEHLALILGGFGFHSDPTTMISGLRKFQSEYAFHLYFFMVQINLLWTLFNLLPIWPLDGGQATQTMLDMVDPRNGARRAHVISLVTAGTLAVMVGSWSQNFFLVLFLAYFAFINFQILQSMHQTRSLGARDDDWWRR